MTCNNICSKYKASKPVGIGRYASGQRRCQVCQIFIKWEGLWCPCCGYRLRTKPRNLKYKAKLRARIQEDVAEKSISIKANSEEAAGDDVEEAKPKKAKSKPKAKPKAKAEKSISIKA